MTDLFTVEHLNQAFLKCYGPDTLLKVSEDKNQDGEQTVLVTIVKKVDSKKYKTSLSKGKKKS